MKGYEDKEFCHQAHLPAHLRQGALARSHPSRIAALRRLAVQHILDAVQSVPTTLHKRQELFKEKYREQARNDTIAFDETVNVGEYSVKFLVNMYEFY
jgi:23S rRNA G2069 N7-methylase RlmK/C1962 C5-methylase RlmI